jgi:hypothetical protein
MYRVALLSKLPQGSCLFHHERSFVMKKTSPGTVRCPDLRGRAQPASEQEFQAAQATHTHSTNMERRYSAGERIVEEREPKMKVVRVRRGRLKVSDAEEFEEGKVCGQAALVGCESPVGEKELFRFFAEGVSDIELSESWLVGFFVGMVDALLQDRKTLPPEMP